MTLLQISWMQVIWFIGAIAVTSVSTMDIKCPAGCSCRNNRNQAMTISDCDISLVDTTFQEPDDKLMMIEFDRVNVHQSARDVFKAYENLEVVIFKNSTFKSMDPKAFSSIDLMKLSFFNSEFTDEPNFISDDLEELILDQCNLEKIPNFDGVKSEISLISLKNNKLTTIRKSDVEKLDGLEEIYLSNNRLEFLPPNLFDSNIDLNILEIDNNLIERFLLNTTNRLETLKISGNRLKSFDAHSSKYLKNLNYLDLSNNMITSITMETLKNMPLLRYINLSYNKLTTLDNDIFKYNDKLEKIILDGNNFNTLPIFNSDVPFATSSFSCQNCGLTSLNNDTFRRMTGLSEINVSNNSIERIEPSFAGKSLARLNLSNNKLTKIGSSAFIKTPKLNEINLSGNSLNSLDPKDFHYLKYLNKIDATNANLTELWSDNYGYKLEFLEVLLIPDNKIEDITIQALDVMPKLKFINVENNNLQCTFHLGHLIVWLIKNEVYSAKYETYSTHEKLSEDASQYFYNVPDQKTYWLKLTKGPCRPVESKLINEAHDKVMEQIIRDIGNISKDDVPIVGAPEEITVNRFTIYSNADDDNEDLDDDDDYMELTLNDQTAKTQQNTSLDGTSYILSITSVFILSALVVLTIAVTTTLVILKKNKTLNINTDNLPRFKIPRWDSLPIHKKHSGSVYRPLSEEISGPPTPRVSRYEFNPTVHSNTVHT